MTEGSRRSDDHTVGLHQGRTLHEGIGIAICLLTEICSHMHQKMSQRSLKSLLPVTGLINFYNWA